MSAFLLMVIVLDLWRLLKLETHDAFTNMAVDEAIVRARIDESVPNTVRLYEWKPSAVSIGRFQDLENEVQLANCKRNGVDIVRRMTGGGAVYHDANDEITYSVVAGLRDLKAQEITTVYVKIYAGLVEALRILGINADFNEGNARTCPNLTVSGQKISGSAQSHKRGVVLQHGTILLNVDLEKMFRLLRVPWANTCAEIVNIAQNKITSIESEIGGKVVVQEVDQALIDGFQKGLGIKLVEGELMPHERELAGKLRKEKYAVENWNLYGKDSLYYRF
jgi:lipoate-protein ligase A